MGRWPERSPSDGGGGVVLPPLSLTKRCMSPGALDGRSPGATLQSLKQAHPQRQRSRQQCPSKCGLGISPTACCGSETPSTAAPTTPCLISPASLVGKMPLDTPRAALIAAQCTPARARPRATPSSCSSCSAEAARRPCQATRGWRRGDQIGRGSYGSVYLARDMQDGFIFAVKNAREEQDSDCEKLRRELEICEDLRHPNIVSCLGHEVVKGHLCIYLEYVSGGSMRSHLEQFGALEEPLLRKASRGILKGLDYLHTHNPPVVHRDLKGANVLVDLSFCCKLADFGCSKRSTQTQTFTGCGSAQWCAPEVFKDDLGFGRKADIWSFGCVVLEMATAADPWGKGAFDNMMAVVHVICMSQRTPPIPEAMPPVGRELAGLCLRRSPKERPRCAELLGLESLGPAGGRPAGALQRSGSCASRPRR